MNEDNLKFIIMRLINNAKETSAEDDESDFEKGRRLAYYEMLDTIKNELGLKDQDLAEFGLDFDISKLI